MKLNKLAKKTVETYVLQGKILSCQEITKRFNRQAGVFVTIYKKGELRGCMGTYLPTCKNIVAETIKNALSAAVLDPRFKPVKPEELKFLEYEVSVLSAPRKIDHLENHDPIKKGLIIKSKNKCGLLLPNLKGIETNQQQLEIVARKAGINLNQEKYELFEFEVEKY